MMNLDGDASADEYIVTALQIFNYCGVDNNGTLRVDVLMDKFAPFIKTNKAEYSYLRSLLDPDQNNPDINVTELATTLKKYSESQKIKTDLDESFNLKSGQVPHDSDSGISTDGFQLLEELQCELKEKTHLAQQLRTQLDFSDRHHEEALAAVTAERDTLRSHLNMLREESTGLSNIRNDYEEVCERLCCTEQELRESRRELDLVKKRAKVLTEQVTVLETEKLTLQEQLSISKSECHRINDMYASRQSALLEEQEALRGERADLRARLRDHDRYLQQLLSEKVLLEMELKDMTNKSNQTDLRMDRSIDISYTEDQMLTALDSLNAESRFVSEGRILDEESFVKALKEDQGRATNMSLFDEIRLSFCNLSRHSLNGLNCTEPYEITEELFDNSLITAGTQTDKMAHAMCENCNKLIIDDCSPINFGTQTEEREIVECNDNELNTDNKCDVCNNGADKKDFDNLKVETKNQATNTNLYVLEVFKDIEVMNIGTQTDVESFHINNNNNYDNCIDCTKCNECDRLNNVMKKLEKDLNVSNNNVMEMQNVLVRYEENLDILKRFVDDGDERNSFLKTVVDNLKTKLNSFDLEVLEEKELEKELLEEKELEKEIAREVYCETCCAGIQTEFDQSTISTQTDLPCLDCVKRNKAHPRLKRYLWDPLKSLFQVFAVLCFATAVVLLCGVQRPRGAAPCRDLPWRWLQPRDLLDLLLTVHNKASAVLKSAIQHANRQIGQKIENTMECPNTSCF